MNGRRVYLNENGELVMAPGDYGKHSNGIWFARCPDPEISMGSLEAHEVVEHEDGTITVQPSILISYDYGDPPVQKRWHGFLERGVWREG